jgi:hypothetical protein
MVMDVLFRSSLTMQISAGMDVLVTVSLLLMAALALTVQIAFNMRVIPDVNIFTLWDASPAFVPFFHSFLFPPCNPLPFHWMPCPGKAPRRDINLVCSKFELNNYSKLETHFPCLAARENDIYPQRKPIG